MTTRFKTWHQGTPTVEETIQQWERFIWQQIRRLYRHRVNDEDRREAYQEACLRLTMMPEDKRRFNSYVTITIVNALRTHLKTLLDNGIPLDQMPEHEDDDGNTEPVEFASAQDMGSEVESRLFLEQITKGMKEEHVRVFELLIQGYKYDEIAEMFGKSKQWVRYIMQPKTKRVRAVRRRRAFVCSGD